MLNLPLVDLPELEPSPTLYSFADTQFEILKKYIQDFEASLDQEHEVGLKLANFGRDMVMLVAEISYEKSVAMIFKGFVDGRYSTLVQHVSQLNLLLTSVEIKPESRKTKIGFVYPKS